MLLLRCVVIVRRWRCDVLLLCSCICCVVLLLLMEVRCVVIKTV